MNHIKKQNIGVQQLEWKVCENSAACLQDNNQQWLLAVKLIIVSKDNSQQWLLAVKMSIVSKDNSQQCLLAVTKMGMAQHSRRVETRSRKQQFLFPANLTGAS